MSHTGVTPPPVGLALYRGSRPFAPSSQKLLGADGHAKCSTTETQGVAPGEVLRRLDCHLQLRGSCSGEMGGATV